LGFSLIQPLQRKPQSRAAVPETLKNVTQSSLPGALVRLKIVTQTILSARSLGALAGKIACITPKP
jgi:hypothetical protein